LVARRIADLDYVTCASTSYLKAHGTPTHPKDLEHAHRLVGYFSSLTSRSFPLVFERAQEKITIATDTAQPIQLVYPANRHSSAKPRVFVDWAVEMFAGKLSTTRLPSRKSD
jgi:LysR family transcriptional regulator for bpeEF and oprC